MIVFDIASYIGGIAFALSGFYVGIKKNLDLMGVFIVAMLTANGGGVVRDALIDRVPGTLIHPEVFYPVIAVLALAALLKLHRRPAVERFRLFQICDSLGLAAFSITGTLAGIEAGLSVFGVMTLAFITAAGGGIIRDILVNEIPSILSSDFYGTISILQAAILFTLHGLDYMNNYTVSAVFAGALGLRVLALHQGWRLPRFSLDG